MIEIDCHKIRIKFIRPSGKKEYRHNHVPSCFVDAINKCIIDEHIVVHEFNGNIKTFKRIENLKNDGDK